jgi:hypothetical protein
LSQDIAFFCEKNRFCRASGGIERASNSNKLQIMKLSYLTPRKKRLLLMGILLLGCIALSYYDYTCCKKGDLEKMAIIYIMDAEEELYTWHFNEGEQ